ncbi:MAG TPA: hypothetical protein VMV68_10230 [Spirochaetia bacterium]|nr:hypothetical protein [Spirochaetia bacterium]
MNRNRNSIIIIVLIIGAAFLFFNPFGGGRQGAAKLPRADQQLVQQLSGYVEQHYQTPADYVLSELGSHTIVFLGEPSKISQNVDFVKSLIPQLYAHGIRNLGIEYALSSDQEKIDRLTTGPSYDPKLANRILFDYLVIWGYQGYADLFQAAWQLNHSLPPGAPPFHIIGLGVKQDWQYLVKKSDSQDPAILRQVFANGVPDQHMAQVIEKSILASGEKALIFTSTRSAFTAYRNSDYAQQMKKMGFSETERAGNIIYDMIGSKSFTILFHQPWPTTDVSSDVYPVGGAIDRMINALPADERSAGFSIDGTPFAALPVTNKSFSAGNSGLTLAGLCDGYIIQGPLSSYTPVAPIPDFIDAANLATARADFPGPKPGNISADDLNAFIKNSLTSLGRYYSALQ